MTTTNQERNLPRNPPFPRWDHTTTQPQGVLYDDGTWVGLTVCTVSDKSALVFLPRDSHNGVLGRDEAVRLAKDILEWAGASE